MKFLGQGFQELEPKQDRHTQTDVTKNVTTLYSLAVTNANKTGN